MLSKLLRAHILARPVQSRAAALPMNASDLNASDLNASDFTVMWIHGNPIRYLISRLLVDSGDSWSRMGTNNCGISKVVVRSNGRIRLMTYNDTGHLPHQSQT